MTKRETLTGEALLKLIQSSRYDDRKNIAYLAGYANEKQLWKAEREALSERAKAAELEKKDEGEYWYECYLTYDGETERFNEDVDIAARYHDGDIDEEALFSCANWDMPTDFDAELMSIECVLVKAE